MGGVGGTPSTSSSLSSMTKHSSSGGRGPSRGRPPAAASQQVPPAPPPAHPAPRFMTRDSRCDPTDAGRRRARWSWCRPGAGCRDLKDRKGILVMLRFLSRGLTRGTPAVCVAARSEHADAGEPRATGVRDVRQRGCASGAARSTL